MDRRQLISGMIGVAALLVAGRATDAECGEATSTAFVEALYQKQARLQTTELPRDDDFEAPFAREMRRLICRGGMNSPR